MKYLTLGEYLKKTYGFKAYKIAIDIGCTCPTRDGKIDTRGCIFCSQSGSGDYAQNRKYSVTKQIKMGKTLVEKKNPSGKYIAYFQNFTNTYGDEETLREKYLEAVDHPDVCIISIATRPDCLSERMYEILAECNKIKPVWVELGLQTIKEESIKYIRRGYENIVYENAVKRLKEYLPDSQIITHVILGLPGENIEDMKRTVEYVVRSGATGIKLQLLHVLEDTDLYDDYKTGKFKVMTEDEYIETLKAVLTKVPENMVIHRLTGDGDKKILCAPLWSGNKRHVYNRIKKEVLKV